MSAVTDITQCTSAPDKAIIQDDGIHLSSPFYTRNWFGVEFNYWERSADAIKYKVRREWDLLCSSISRPPHRIAALGPPHRASAVLRFNWPWVIRVATGKAINNFTSRVPHIKHANLYHLTRLQRLQRRFMSYVINMDAVLVREALPGKCMNELQWQEHFPALKRMMLNWALAEAFNELRL